MLLYLVLNSIHQRLIVNYNLFLLCFNAGVRLLIVAAGGLNLIRVGFLGIRFEMVCVGVWGCPKLVKIMLQT